MGIRDLWTMVKDTEQICPVSELKQKYAINRVAVDANVVISQFYRGHWSTEAKKARFNPKVSHEATLTRLFGFCKEFADLGIELVWCFDGAKSSQKLATAERQEEGLLRLLKLAEIWKEVNSLCPDTDLIAPYTAIMRKHLDTIEERLPAAVAVAREKGLDMSSLLPGSLTGKTEDSKQCSLSSEQCAWLIHDKRAAPAQAAMASPEAATTSTEATDTAFGEQASTDVNLASTETKTTGRSFQDALDDLCGKLQWSAIMPDGLNEDVRFKLARAAQNCVRVPEISEAEKLASILNRIGYVQAVYSNDSDLIALNTPLIIKDIKAKKAHVFAFGDIVKKLAITADRVFDLCVILSNDFNARVHGKGPVTALKLVRDPRFDISDYEFEHGPETVQLCSCKKFLGISEEDIALVANHLH